MKILLPALVLFLSVATAPISANPTSDVCGTCTAGVSVGCGGIKVGNVGNCGGCRWVTRLSVLSCTDGVCVFGPSGCEQQSRCKFDLQWDYNAVDKAGTCDLIAQTFSSGFGCGQAMPGFPPTGVSLGKTTEWTTIATATKKLGCAKTCGYNFNVRHAGTPSCGTSQFNIVLSCSACTEL